MNSYRKTAILVGILFIIATGAPMLSIPFIGLINAPDYLANVAANATRVTTGALLELIMALAIAGIAISIYPVLKKHNQALAIGYFGARITEGVLFIVVAVISLPSLLTLSQEFVKAGTPDASHFQTLGTLLVAAHDLVYLLSGEIVFSLSALILNYVLFQTKLVPRWLSVWGVIGAALLLAGALSRMFGLFDDTSALETILFLPIALQEMAFAVWLIVKGFNTRAIASMSGE
jgi:hypothetical protein